MSRESCTVQLTIRPGESPMLTIYADTPADAQRLLQEVITSGLGSYIHAPSPAPAARDPLPEAFPARPVRNEPPAGQLAGDQPICQSRGCSRAASPMLESAYGGWWCPGTNPSEAGGACRQVFDRKGQRRKPTVAELAAARARVA